MTPRHPYRMPLSEKIILGTLTAAAAIGAMLLASPDAKSDEPHPVVQHCPTTDGLTCSDPVEWLP